MTYHLNKEEATLSQLQSLMRTAKSGMKGKSFASTPAATAPLLAIGKGKGKKRKAPPKQNWKGKYQVGSSNNGSKVKSGSKASPAFDPKETTCFYCLEKGHWK